MRVLQAVWHWEAPHPDRQPGEKWGQIVCSYAIDDNPADRAALGRALP